MIQIIHTQLSKSSYTAIYTDVDMCLLVVAAADNTAA